MLPNSQILEVVRVDVEDSGLHVGQHGLDTPGEGFLVGRNDGRISSVVGRTGDGRVLETG
jgi:hypothetical protein